MRESNQSSRQSASEPPPGEYVSIAANERARSHDFELITLEQIKAVFEENGRLREALEIAHEALERTNRDTAFGYEDKKAAEDYIRRVLKETDRA